MSSINMESETSRAITMSIPSTLRRTLVSASRGRAKATIMRTIPRLCKTIGTIISRERKEGRSPFKAAIEPNCKVGIRRDRENQR